MADHESEIPAMDYAAHRGTYAGFMVGIKYIVISIAILLALMAAFL